MASIASTVSKSFIPMGMERRRRYWLSPATMPSQSWFSTCIGSSLSAGRAGGAGDQPALVQHHDALGHREHHIHVVFGEEYGKRPLTGEALDERHESPTLR